MGEEKREKKKTFSTEDSKTFVPRRKKKECLFSDQLVWDGTGFHMLTTRAAPPRRAPTATAAVWAGAALPLVALGILLLAAELAALESELRADEALEMAEPVVALDKAELISEAPEDIAELILEISELTCEEAAPPAPPVEVGPVLGSGAEDEAASPVLVVWACKDGTRGD